MQSQTQVRVASLLVAATGIWMMVLPFFTGLEGGVLWSLLVSGGILTLSGGVQLFVKSTLPSILCTLTALWLLVSLFIFPVSTAVLINILVAGILTFFASLWDGFEVGGLADNRISLSSR